MNSYEVIEQNERYWEDMVYSQSEGIALPKYGCMLDEESKLHLLTPLWGKCVLDIGCGSGQSLEWCGSRGAQLWGVDTSRRQIELTERRLRHRGYRPMLIASPLEQECGLPRNYFDLCYSVCAIGWSTDLERTFALISSYLKPWADFVFSWDHPFLHCLSGQGEKPIFDSRYLKDETFSFMKDGVKVSVQNRLKSDYIDALVKADFAVDYILEVTDLEMLCGNKGLNSASPDSEEERAPMSLLVKAHKLTAAGFNVGMI